MMFGHSLRGLCGLKLHILSGLISWTGSQPARAVWIEIANEKAFDYYKNRHSLRGLCGLKSQIGGITVADWGHSLRGLCGLKSRNDESKPLAGLGHSLRGLCGLKSVDIWVK